MIVIRFHSYLLLFFFSDGQKIAKKLCSSISKETKAAQRLLEEYNAAASELSSSEPVLSLQDVLPLQSEFWRQNPSITSNSDVPWKTKEEIIQSYLTIKRCEEELKLLTSEMQATVQYWFDRVVCISTKLEQMNCPNQYERGVKCVLLQLKRDAEIQHQCAANTFSKLIHVPSDIMSKEHINSSSDTEDDSETESEDTDSDMDI